jgi:curli biogenesis system outer membrane secretion channel CsgG
VCELRNEELGDLCRSYNTLRKVGFGGYDGLDMFLGSLEERNGYNILVRKSLGARRLGRSRRRSEDKIKMDLRIVDCKEGGGCS